MNGSFMKIVTNLAMFKRSRNVTTVFATACLCTIFHVRQLLHTLKHFPKHDLYIKITILSMSLNSSVLFQCLEIIKFTVQESNVKDTRKRSL